MEPNNSCAECLNLGRAVYCMQCIRMNKGRKDMFRSNNPTPPPLPQKEHFKADDSQEAMH